MTSRSRHIEHFYFVAITLLAILLGFLTFYRLTPYNIFFTEDIGTSFAAGYLNLHGEPALLGPPSHVGGRHLGPIYYWYVSLGMWLGAYDPLATVYIFTLLKLLSAFGMVSLASRLVPFSYRPIAAIGALFPLLAGRYLEIVRTPWHSDFLLIPSFFEITTAYLCIRYGRRYIPFFLLASTILLQTHYSSIPLILGLLPFIMLSPQKTEISLSKIVRAISSTRAQYCAIALTVLLWIPMVIYIFRYENFFEHFGSDGSAKEVPAGFKSAIRTMLSFLRLYYVGNYGEQISRLYRPFVDWTLVALMASCLVKFRTIANISSKRLLAALGLSGLCFILALTFLPKPLYNYYLYPFIYFPPILGAVTLVGAIYSISHAIHFGYKIFAGLYVLILIFSLGAGFYRNLTHYTRKNFSEFHSLQNALEITDIIREDYKKNGADIPFVVLARGYAQIMGSPYNFLMGPEHFSEIAYSESFKEMPTFLTKEAKPELAYLVVCPKPSESHRLEMWGDLRKYWKRKYEIGLMCRTCKACEMFVLERRLKKIKVREATLKLPESPLQSH